MDEPLKQCPKCNSTIERKISMIHSCIMRGKEMNQFSDVKAAKYWRDRNGVRHKVTAADGSSHSPTVPKAVTATPEQINARKNADKLKTKKRLQKIRHGFIKK